MRLQLRGKRIDWPEPLRVHVERQVHLVLSRFGRRIGLVTVDIHPEAGASAGLQAVCRIAVKLLPEGRILVEDGQGDLYAAISRLAERAGRAVERALERERRYAAGPAPSKAGRGSRL